jgi:glycine oxidase
MKKYDVVIVGGGVIGTSIAFQLSKRGKNVAILERFRVAGEASSAAAGMLGAQVEMDQETGPLFELAVRSRALFPQVAEELREISGIDIGLVQKGMLRVALSYDEEANLKETVRCQHAAGQKAEWVTSSEVLEREPHITPEIKGAIYIPGDGHVLAPELSRAFAKAAAHLGADIYEFTTVNALLSDKGKVHGVGTENDTYYADEVVIAGGSWSSQLLNGLRIEQKVYPVKGECFSVITHKPLLTSTVFSHGCYLVPKRGGRLVVGATVEENTFDKKVSVAGISQLLQRAERLLPAISSAEWESCWAGLRPQSTGGMPILGAHPDMRGLYIATGHFRNGILLSPLTGILMAELIEGKAEAMDILKPFEPQRV